MNNFTKEELEQLTQIINHYRGLTDDMGQLYLPLYKKLQSMIDRYCDHEIVTADMKEHQAVCFLYENDEKYFTIHGSSFAFGSHASLDMAHKIICLLAIGANHFDNEWIDRIIFRLQELKQHE